MFVWKKKRLNPCCVLSLILFFFLFFFFARCHIDGRKKEHLKTHRRSDIGNMLWLLYRLTTKFWAIVAFSFWLWHKTLYIFSTQRTYEQRAREKEMTKERKSSEHRWMKWERKKNVQTFFNACSFAYFFFFAVLGCALMFLFLFTPSHSWFQRRMCVALFFCTLFVRCTLCTF